MVFTNGKDGLSMSTGWLSVWLDGRMVEINAAGEIREIDNDKPKNPIGFRASDSTVGSPTHDVCTECRNKGTEKHCKAGKPGIVDCLEGNKP